MSARRSRRTERGHTLLELAVAAVPLGLIGLLLFSVFGFTMAYSRRGEAGVETLQQARVALHFMAAELHEASAAPGAIVVWSRADGVAVDGVGFLTARAEAPGRTFAVETSGLPRWQNAVYFLHDPTRQELRRIAAELTGPSPLADEATRSMGRLLARRVKQMRVVRRGDVITISLTVAGSPGDAVLETSITPRN